MSIRVAFGLCLVLFLGSMATGCGDNDEPPVVVAEPKQKLQVCERLPAQAELCSVTPGGASKLLKGIVLTPDTLYVGGRVAIDAAGVIQCVGCNCADDAATTVTCPAGVISPGLINAHDHITFAQNSPVRDTGERYEHRHDWRSGLRGHTEVPVPGGATDDNIRWGELRFLFGGGTSVNGSGGVAGILRNLDRATLLEGLSQPAILYQTFPLADSGQSTQRRTTCNYGAGDTTMTIINKDSYTPHIAEGIDDVSRNEFLCTTSDDQDKIAPGVSTDLFLPQTASIHSVGLLASDYAVMASRKSSIIWSPRTNVSLYGDTAQVTTADRLGVRIALGTDWIATGSSNMLRELQCASQLNETYYDNHFSDLDLWKMATINAAAAVAMDDAIGVLEAGKVADIAIFDGRERSPLRAIIEAAPRNVALVMRGGKALYGDHNVVAGLRSSGCDAFEMCGAFKQVCVQDETTRSFSQLVAANLAAYPAFYCGKPAGEPTCTPSRPKAVNGSTVYTGAITNSDLDGDGLANSSDNCPKVFNPIRPLDNGKQADGDGDGVGDPCDVCPLTANATTCVAPDPKDRDADGRPDASDNCPGHANANQADGDGDGKGDACDDCAQVANPGAAACPGTIYTVKNGTVPPDVQVQISNALVTGKGSNGFFVQVKESDPGYTGANYSGLFVFTTNAAFLTAAVVGGRVNVEGQITNFFGQLELSNVATVSRVGGTTEATPAPTMVTIDEVRLGGSRAVALESVLVRVGSSSVTAVNTAAGEFTASQGAASMIVDDFLFLTQYFPVVTQAYVTLTGILAFRNGSYRLEPRAQDDLSAVARLAGFTTSTAFIRNGATGVGTIPTAMEVRLTAPVLTATTVTIASSDTSALTVVGGQVVIPAGQLGAPVLLNALAPSAGVTLTATLSDVTATTSVRVLTDTDVPTAITLTPASTTINPGTTVNYTLTLNVPAPVGGLVVNLAATPAGAGTVPASVTVPVDQVSATFNYVDNRTAAGITITATYAAVTGTASISVIEPPTGLVINEIDYDQLGTDGAEYVEIYNGTGAAVDFTNLALAFVNGSNVASVQYMQASLAGVGSLAAGGYLVVGTPGIAVAPGSTLFTPTVFTAPSPTSWPTTNAIQNGDPDAVLLFNTATGRILDRFSYGNAGRAVTTATVTGISGSVTFVEGTALDGLIKDLATTALPNGALVRSPNGTDTNNANADWKLATTLTPGAANPTVP